MLPQPAEPARPAMRRERPIASQVRDHWKRRKSWNIQSEAHSWKCLRLHTHEIPSRTFSYLSSLMKAFPIRNIMNYAVYTVISMSYIFPPFLMEIGPNGTHQNLYVYGSIYKLWVHLYRNLNTWCIPVSDIKEKFVDQSSRKNELSSYSLSIKW